jgi:hypothetical protein
VYEPLEYEPLLEPNDHELDPELLEPHDVPPDGRLEPHDEEPPPDPVDREGPEND